MAMRTGVSVVNVVLVSAMLLVVYAVAIVVPVNSLTETSSATISPEGRLIEPFFVYGFTYDADGITPLNGCVVTIKDVRTGEVVVWDENYEGWDPTMNVYSVSMGQSYWLIGDVINVTATKGTQIGWNEGPAPEALEGVQIDVTLSAEIFTMNLVTGWNLVSLPLVGYGYKASTLGLNPGDVVSEWNSATKTYRNHIVGIPLNDFDIAPSTGYWIDVPSGTRTLTIYGTAPTASQSRTITVPAGGGWVTIGFVGWNTTRHASDVPGMYSVPGGITIVSYWNPAKKEYSNWLSAIPTVNNFALIPGQGYEILCSASGTFSYGLAVPPVASFTYTVDNHTVNVDASASTGSIVSYEWDWGDGTTGTGMITSHTYTISSSVPAMTQDLMRKSRSLYPPHDIFGYTYESDGVTLLPGCYVYVTNMRTGETVVWDESRDGWDPTVAAYAVNLVEFPSGYYIGDLLYVEATKDTLIGWTEAPVTNNENGFDQIDVTLNHTLTVITLTVTDAIGQTDSISKPVEWVHHPSWPKASFTVSPARGYPTTIFTFDASNSSDAETPSSELQVRWDWEDDGIWDTGWSTEKQICHQFASVGTYVVSLQVMDTDGLISAECKYYYVYIYASGWIPEDVDHFSNYEGAVGLGNSIAVDSNNKVHISYATYNIGAVKYATNAGGSWTVTTIDSSGVLGDLDGSTSIALDSRDKVHISYYDFMNGNLKYATNVGGSWATYTLDSMGTVGLSSSIAIDSNDKVHISYYDRTSADLKYATNAGGSWACFTVDSKKDVGEHTSIAIDTSNHIHISYYDRTNQHLKYATDASGSWTCYTLDSTGDAGYSDTSIAVDSSNKVHICYDDGTNTALKYATNVDGPWTYSTLDSTYEIRLRCSIALDSSDNVHISYRGNNHLKYATNAGGSWTCLTLDSIGYWVSFNSIAVDSIDKVHISYYCEGNGDLMYMHEA